MELFAGFVLCLVVEWFLWGAVKIYRTYLAPPPPPPQPRSPAQQANQAVYEDQVRHHPRVVSMRVTRRPRRRIVERESKDFE